MRPVYSRLTDHPGYEAHAVDFVRTFLTCPEVHQIRFYWSDITAAEQNIVSIADLCTRLRLKKEPESYVEVFFSLDYLA